MAAIVSGARSPACAVIQLSSICNRIVVLGAMAAAAQRRRERFRFSALLARRGLGFTRRRQCGPCDLNGLRHGPCDLDARLFGVVSPLKHERKNGLLTFIEDVEAIAWVGHPCDIADRAVREGEARQCLVSLNKRPVLSRTTETL